MTTDLTKQSKEKSDGTRLFRCVYCGTQLFTKNTLITCCSVPQPYPGASWPESDSPNPPPLILDRDPVKNPCVHVGKQLHLQECPTCKGSVKVYLFECDKYGQCTLKKPIGKMCCMQCPAYLGSKGLPEAKPEFVDSIRGSYEPRSPGWEFDMDVAAAHKALMDEHVATIQSNQMPDEFDGRGIVVLGGGSKYFTCAYMMVTLLRRTGCMLPIEWWFLDHHEMDSQMVAMAESLGGVDCVNLQHRIDRYGRVPRMMGGWHAKAWSIMLSRFKEVLFLDADQIPLRDPYYLFDDPNYKETGAVFWPDYAPMGWSISTTAFQVAGLPVPSRTSNPTWMCPTDYTPFETGQILIDKSRHWTGLELTTHINDHSEFWYADTARDRHKWHVYGDKDTFYLAWNRLKSNYTIAPPCQFVGDNNAGAFIQHDFSGEPLFHHRVQPTSKWSLHGINKAYPGCENHEDCEQLLLDLRSKWMGHPYDYSDESPEETAVALRALGRKLWFRKGFGQKEIELLREGKTSDPEYHWTIRIFGGGPLLVISTWSRAITFMGQDDFGNWVNHDTKNFLLEAPPTGFNLPPEPDEVGLWNEIVNKNEYNIPDKFNDNDVVVDIGAHCGIFTTMCLDRGARQVIAVEPHPDNFLMLHENIRTKFSNRAILLPAAAWRCDKPPGQIFIAQKDGALHSGGWSAIGTTSGIAVDTIPFDVVIKLAAPVRLVKLDCEGSEWGILETFKDWDLVEEWCGEYHHATESEANERLFNIFSKVGFKIRIVPNKYTHHLGHFWARR